MARTAAPAQSTQKRVAELQAKMAQAAKKPTAALSRTLAKAPAKPLKEAAKPKATKHLPFDGGKAAAPMPAAPPEPEKKKIPAGLKIPKAVGAAADLLYSTRNARLKMGQEVAVLQAYESALKDHLINTLPKSESTGAAGKLCRVTVGTEDVPRAEDWSLIYAHIVAQYLDHKKRKTGLEDGAFALLNRALNGASVEDLWAAGKKVPGVKSFRVAKVGINKL